MQPSRRAVLRAGVLAAAVVGVPGLARSAQGLTVLAAPVRLRRAEFVPHVGSRFLFTDGSTSYRARLVSVGDHDRAKGDQQRFTLLFDTAGATPPEGIYTVRHAVLHEVALFVAPVGARPGRYEAVVAS